MKKIVLLVASCAVLFGFSGDVFESDTIHTGQLTENESRIMHEAWCDYNQDRDFIKNQCE